MVDLKNCPFCGSGKAFSGATLDAQFYAMCGNDNCSGMVGYFASEAESRTAWNTRSDPAVRDRVTDDMRAEALRLLQQKDERDDRIQEIIEDLREIVLLMPAASRPDGLMKKAQDAVYGMRGRLRLTDDAILTAALRTSPPEPASGWVMAPVEPTTEMKRAANRAVAVTTPDGTWALALDEATRAYKAMLAAAPTPPAKEPQ